MVVFSRWHTETEIAQALRKTKGFQSKAAELLKVSPSAITQRIKKSPRLQKVLEQVKQKNLDNCEDKLLEAIDDSKDWAIKYYLSNKGKERGYGPDVGVNVAVVPSLTVVIENESS